ncbi:hypothetical protein [Bradyrhizobium cenepequi]
MTWSPGAAGSDSRTVPAASSGLTSAIATAAALTMLSIKVTMAMPLPT